MPSNSIYTPIESSVKELFDDKEGFLIPDYQRDYSWEKENVLQLFEDICLEANDYIEDFNNGDRGEYNAVRFLGTLIQIKKNGSDFTQRYTGATPKSVISVVDGQQRLSTVVLISVILYCKLQELQENLGRIEELDESTRELLHAILDSRKEEILSIVSIRLSGKPLLKPRIIREATDRWTSEGSLENYYKSDISYAVALFLDAVERKEPTRGLLDVLKRIGDGLIKTNLLYIEKIVSELVHCHLDSRGNPVVDDTEITFPSARKIAGLGSKLNSVWGDPYPQLTSIIQDTHSSSKAKDAVSSTLQIMFFSYFMMERCYFVSIMAPDEDRAFDMFQSLNTSGTPLTVIETFRPIAARELGEDSRRAVDEHFKRIFQFFKSDRGSTADEKIKDTNVLLGHFAYVFSATTLAKTFSSQRRWLQKKFTQSEDSSRREEFIRQLADIASFLAAIRLAKQQQTDLEHLDELERKDKQLATFNTLFLDDAGNRLGITILARFYARVLQKRIPNAQNDFLEASRIVAAFYILWRSARNNSQLDDSYRRVLRDTRTNDGICWESGRDNRLVEILRERLIESLAQRQLNVKMSWLQDARVRLNYEDAKKVCKFVLLLVSHDRDPSTDEPGLFGSVTRADAEDELSSRYYFSLKHRSIEHVAPDSQTEEWDSNIYTHSSQLKHSIGNLTLLPNQMNSQIGNQPWRSKWIYFWQVGTREIDPIKVQEKASCLGIKVDERLVSRLTEARFMRLNAPIATMDPSLHTWDARFIEKRRDQILELLWEVLSKWLGLP